MPPDAPAILPILMYHSVDTQCADPYRRWMVTPAELDGHCSALKDLGYDIVTASTLTRLSRDPKTRTRKLAALTFDDGLADFLHGAMPVLARHGVPATLYVTTGQVGRSANWLASLGEGGRRMLTWAELRDLQSAGIELGAHSVSHPELDAIALRWARREIIESKMQLENGTGRRAESFAYPHGYSNDAVRQTVREAGFGNACRVRHALSTAEDNIFAQARVIVTSEIAPGDLGNLLGGGVLPVAPPVERWVGRGWRMVRRVRRLLDREQHVQTSRVPASSV